MASFLIEFGAVIVRFQARQQQSDGLVSFGLVSFGLVSFGLVSFGLVSFGLVSFGQFFLMITARNTSALTGQFEKMAVFLRRAKRKEPRPVAAPSDLYPKTWAVLIWSKV